jgi:hypothetical protein
MTSFIQQRNRAQGVLNEYLKSNGNVSTPDLQETWDRARLAANNYLETIQKIRDTSDALKLQKATNEQLGEKLRQQEKNLYSARKG